jgi:hypothetical protein
MATRRQDRSRGARTPDQEAITAARSKAEDAAKSGDPSGQVDGPQQPAASADATTSGIDVTQPRER